MTIFDRQQLVLCRVGLVAKNRSRDAEALMRYRNRKRVRQKHGNTRAIRITRIVADYFGLPFESIAMQDRHQYPVRVRQICMYLLRVVGFGFVAIGHQLRRDHGTVFHGVASIKNQIGFDTEMARQIDILLDLIRAADAAFVTQNMGVA